MSDTVRSVEQEHDEKSSTLHATNEPPPLPDSPQHQPHIESDLRVEPKAISPTDAHNPPNNTVVPQPSPKLSNSAQSEPPMHPQSHLSSQPATEPSDAPIPNANARAESQPKSQSPPQPSHPYRQRQTSTSETAHPNTSIPASNAVSTSVDTPPTTKSSVPEVTHTPSVLVIPLDDRVTPHVIAKRFPKYGQIQKISQLKRSSACIVTFASTKEAQVCINTLHAHDKVRVRPANKDDWSMVSSAADSGAPTPHRISSAQQKTTVDRQLELEAKAESRRKLLEMQQERVQLMYQQKQAMSLLKEQDNLEWRRRETRHQLMEKRVTSVFKTSQEVHGYLSTNVAQEMTHEYALRKDLSLFATTETGTVRQAAVAIDSLQKNRWEQFEDMNKRVFQPAVESANKFCDRLKQQFSYFQGTSSRVTEDLGLSKKKYESDWQKYESGLQLALDAQSKGEVIAADPFLLGKQFDNSQKKYKQSQIQYNEEMSRLFRELILADGRRIDSMKSILVDYFLAEKARAVNRVKMLESSLEYIKSIDREKDVNDFVHRGEFLISNADSQPVSSGSTNELVHDVDQLAVNPATTDAHSSPNRVKNIFDSGIQVFSQRTREISSLIYKDVVRYGTVYRPGRIIASNWKPLFAVVTKFGFFHAFENKDDLKPLITVELARVDVEMKKQESSSSKKPHTYTFEISVPNTSWISLTGAPTKYLFKADSFEDCVDWVVAVKKFILK